MKKLVAENPYAARGVYKSEGVMFEKMKDLPSAVMAYEKGGLYSNAYAAYLESGQAEAAAEYVKKLEAENPRAALKIYKVSQGHGQHKKDFESNGTQISSICRNGVHINRRKRERAAVRGHS